VGRAVPGRQGRAVQVDPIRPTLKAPGTKRLKLEYDRLLLCFAFYFNVRRCTKEEAPAETGAVAAAGGGRTGASAAAAAAAAAALVRPGGDESLVSRHVPWILAQSVDAGLAVLTGPRALYCIGLQSALDLLRPHGAAARVRFLAARVAPGAPGADHPVGSSRYRPPRHPRAF